MKIIYFLLCYLLCAYQCAKPIGFSIKNLADDYIGVPFNGLANSTIPFDFDRDGYNDFVLISTARYHNEQYITIFLNNRATTPTFQRFLAKTIPGDRLKHFAIGDFNEDGYVDICSAANDGISIFINDYPTSYSFTEKFLPGGNRQDIQCVDLNGNNKPDMLLLTAQNGQNEFSIIYDYNPNETTHTEILSRPNVGDVQAWQIIDWNQDGKLDVVPSYNDKIIVWKNIGGFPVKFEETFIANRPSNTYPTRAVHFNANDSSEFLVPNEENLLIYENSGSAYTSHTLLTMSDWCAETEGHDLDSDGDVDVVLRTTIPFNTREFFIVENFGSNNYDKQPQPILPGGDYFTFVMSDINANGNIDILIIDNTQYGSAPSSHVFIAYNLNFQKKSGLHLARWSSYK